MPETIVASSKWKVLTEEFSPACDNSLLVDSDSMADFPAKKNQEGICLPECSVCVTAFPQNVSANCFFTSIPRLYEVDFPTPLKGNHPWSSCFEFSGTTMSYLGGASPCTYFSSPFLKPVPHTRILVPLFPELYSCGRFSFPCEMVGTIGKDSTPGAIPNRGRLSVIVNAAWGIQSGHYSGLSFVWTATQLTSPFGKIALTLAESFRRPEWQYFSIPQQIFAKSISQG